MTRPPPLPYGHQPARHGPLWVALVSLGFAALAWAGAAYAFWVRFQPRHGPPPPGYPDYGANFGVTMCLGLFVAPPALLGVLFGAAGALIPGRRLWALAAILLNVAAFVAPYAFATGP